MLGIVQRNPHCSGLNSIPAAIYPSRYATALGASAAFWALPESRFFRARYRLRS